MCLVGVEPDRENYLVDIRARSDAEAWLIIDQDVASSGVDSVYEDAQGAGWLLGDLQAQFIPRAGDLTVKKLHVNVGKDGKLSAVLASISVDGKTPQRWLEEGGEVDHRFTFGGKLVPLEIEVRCVTWFDLRAPVHATSPERR